MAHADNTLSSSSLSNKKSPAASSGAKTESKTESKTSGTTIVLSQEQWETLQKQFAQLQNTLKSLPKEEKQPTTMSIFITYLFLYAVTAMVAVVLYDYFFRFKSDHPNANFVSYALDFVKTKEGNSLLDAYSTLDALLAANKDGKLLETVLKDQKVPIEVDETDEKTGKKTGKKVQKYTSLWDLFSPYLNNQGNNTLGNYILEQVNFGDKSNLMQFLEKCKGITDQLTPFITSLSDGSIVDYMLDNFTITVCETIDRSDKDFEYFDNFKDKFLEKIKDSEKLENKEINIEKGNIINKVAEEKSFTLEKEDIGEIVDKTIKPIEDSQCTNIGFYKFLSEFSSSEDCKFLKYSIFEDKSKEEFLALNSKEEIVSKFTYEKANSKGDNNINNNDDDNISADTDISGGNVSCKFEIQKKVTLRSLLNDPINLVHNLNKFVEGLNSNKDCIVEYILKNQKIGDKTLWEIFSPVLSLFTGGSFDGILNYKITVDGKEKSINDLFVEPIVDMLNVFTGKETNPEITAFRKKVSGVNEKAFYEKVVQHYGNYIEKYRKFENKSKVDGVYKDTYDIKYYKGDILRSLRECKKYLELVLKDYEKMLPSTKEEKNSSHGNVVLDIYEIVNVILNDNKLLTSLSETTGIFSSGNAIGAIQFMGGYPTRAQLRPENRFSLYSLAKNALVEVKKLLNTFNKVGTGGSRCCVNGEGFIYEKNNLI